MAKKLQIRIGHDPDQYDAWEIAVESLLKNTSAPVEIHRLAWYFIKEYDRPVRVERGQRIDVISGAPMTTAHAIARFFVPYLQEFKGVCLFLDGDILVRGDVGEIFDYYDSRFAVQVVKHDYRPKPGLKKKGDQQIPYERKNWSSCVLWNCSHPANKILTPEYVNSAKGRELHQFCWLEDSLIGSLPEEWNWLAGWSDPAINPSIVHFTEGLPDNPGYENTPFADEWRAYHVR